MRKLYYAFIDELDSIKSNSRVLIIATTNKLDGIDNALRRGGRLDINIGFEMPSPTDRFEILKVHLNNLKLSQSANTTLFSVSVSDDDLE